MEKRILKLGDKQIKVDIDFSLAELKHLLNMSLSSIERSEKEEGDAIKPHLDLVKKLDMYIADREW